MPPIAYIFPFTTLDDKNQRGVGISALVIQGLSCAWQMDAVPTRPEPNRIMRIVKKVEYVE
jgi:hypothetical protein